MKLIGIVIIIIGFILKLDTFAIVLLAGIVTGLVSDMSFISILKTLGSTFVSQRYMSLFLLALPIIGVCERYGLKERAIKLINNSRNLSTGKLLTLYIFIKEIAAATSIRFGGHAEFIRPIINPMAQEATKIKYGFIDNITEEKIKCASAAMDNYGFFFSENLFIASSSVLLITGTLSELGYAVKALDVSKASVPVALLSIFLAFIQNYILDKKLSKKYESISKNNFVE